jgi:hypothetical protein
MTCRVAAFPIDKPMAPGFAIGAAGPAAAGCAGGLRWRPRHERERP